MEIPLVEQPKQLSFEDCYVEIEAQLEKNRIRWTYKADLMMDFDDVKMKFLAHIFKKWHQYDQSRPLGAWVATVFKNQFSNLLRDLYLSTSSPCSQCPCNLGNGACSLFGMQSNECGLYEKWNRTKRHSHEVRLPLPLENHMQEVESLPQDNLNIEGSVQALHNRIRELLTISEWEIYKRLYIDGQTDDEIATVLGFKSNESGRKRGYKRIRAVKTLAFKLGKEILRVDGIDGLT